MCLIHVLNIHTKKQENLCNPAGTTCYKRVKENMEKCFIPCKGLYADVEKGLEVIKIRQDKRRFYKLIENYDKYKRGFEEDIDYPRTLSSKLFD